jgi:hypothetical protein
LVRRAATDDAEPALVVPVGPGDAALVPVGPPIAIT